MNKKLILMQLLKFSIKYKINIYYSTALIFKIIYIYIFQNRNIIIITYTYLDIFKFNFGQIVCLNKTCL